MQQIISNCEERMKKCVSSLEGDYQNLRTGRASTALFDKIKVDYYGAETPLNQVASLSVPEARLVVIQPWDKSLLSAIEKELGKQSKEKAEQSKVAVRNVRRDAMDELKKKQKAGEISEDEQKEGETKIQKLTDNYIASVQKIADAKEKEIMEI